jgi:8-oxo-dGTP pyrophosphatase MutT (NUDIX family)
MKEVLYNYDNLTIDDIDEVIVRTKGLIINDNDEITLGYCDGTYQFPGGHLEENEKLSDCLLREIKEETGIEIKDAKMKPFQKITHYTKNYHNSGKNRQNEIYYYIVRTNTKFDLDNTSFDEEEQRKGFTVKTIPLSSLEKTLNDSVIEKPKNAVIVEEMLDVYKEYNKIKDR